MHPQVLLHEFTIAHLKHVLNPDESEKISGKSSKSWRSRVGSELDPQDEPYP